jgi:hypothetical protein
MALLTVKNVGGYEFDAQQLAVIRRDTRWCPLVGGIKKLDD